MQAPRVLVVSGSARPDGQVVAVVEYAVEVAHRAGAQVRVHDLSRLRLPLMEQDAVEQGQLPPVRTVRADAAWAEGFVLVTPEYHGNMSGALKNWFDFLYLELAGKFAGVVAVTGGGGGDMSLTAVRNCFNWCHGFTLPYQAAVRPGDFEEGRLRPGGVAVDRIARIVFDVCRYAPVVGTAFEQARRLGPELASGVAGLHHDDPT
ncbi:NADPH-dependent FMN reductase [Paraliomyxa miuraensis]|uniref:NADPH-dependent FMN reductase n=1 Tax=Paraliomyxa miuraensis TaxID=376150 RepID=UPI00225C3B66|nr:NAD(P)H-dependent oxidoreductase [Paraliomyxa miuraensis]MCX4244470.1 NAD(P)H-dependent oxidoreductase [Paraliomyxa miuraensis]